MMPQIKCKESLFDDFYNEHIKLSAQKYSSTQELIDDPPQYDMYMVGSDQTWNPYVGRNPDAFYLTFAPKSSRRVSYAPSVSASNMTSEQRIRSRCLLTNVDELSCREQEGAELLRKITERNVEKVLDPVFLLSAKQWNEVSASISHPSKYILQYMIGGRVEHRQYVQRISKYLGLPIVSIPCVPMDLNARNTKKCWVGPDGFISLIRDAELICTDSFHGTAFSLLFQKPVYSFCKYDDNEQLSGNSRLRDVYMEFGIDNRIIKSFDHLPDKDDVRIDYNKVQCLREKALDRSHEYLRRILL